MRKLGQGTYGTVYLCRQISSGKQCVMKRMLLSTLNSKERQSAFQEAQLLQQLSHPNVVGYMDTLASKTKLYLFMQYCDGGDLERVIDNAKKERSVVDQPQLLDWFVQMSLALQYLHSRSATRPRSAPTLLRPITRGLTAEPSRALPHRRAEPSVAPDPSRRRILHRDLKTANVFLTRKGIVKLGDFGVSRVLSATAELAKTFVGTPYYLSPELLTNQPYGHASDVWALGCIFYEVPRLRRSHTAQRDVPRDALLTSACVDGGHLHACTSMLAPACVHACTGMLAPARVHRHALVCMLAPARLTPALAWRGLRAVTVSRHREPSP